MLPDEKDADGTTPSVRQSGMYRDGKTRTIRGVSEKKRAHRDFGFTRHRPIYGVRTIGAAAAAAAAAAVVTATATASQYLHSTEFELECREHIQGGAALRELSWYPLIGYARAT